MDSIQKHFFKTLLVTVIIYIASRLFGSSIIESNNWSFILHQNLSFTSFLKPLGLGMAIFIGAFFATRNFEMFIKNKIAVYLSALGILIFFYLLSFDSFLYGGGNLRMNQISISPTIHAEWFEKESIFVVALFYNIIQSLNIFADGATKFQDNLSSGHLSWLLFSMTSTLFSMVGAWKLSNFITRDNASSIPIFLIIIFGAHSLLLFGYIGIEPAIVAFTIWFALFGLQSIQGKSKASLVKLWAIFIVSIFFYILNLYLLPALIYLTLVNFKRQKKQLIQWKLASLFLLGLLVFFFYEFASSNFRFAQFFLDNHGFNPNSSYTIFSLNHISDIFQSLLLLFPQAILIIFLLLKRKSENSEAELGMLLLLSLSGLTIFFITNPPNSFPLDLPSLSAFLTPLSIFLGFLVSREHSISQKISRPIQSLALISLFIPLFYLPVYSEIENSDSYLEKYFEENEHLYLEGCIAFRDSYFFKKEYTKADAWEWKQPIYSQTYLNFKGCTELIADNRNSEALKVLYRIIVQNPYWTAPREQVANVQLGFNRFKLAKAQIDTSLMIEPYDKNHHLQLLQYYIKASDFAEGFKASEYSLTLFPGDMEILNEHMAIVYRRGDLVTADSLATHIIENDATIFFPYVIKGFIAEYNNDIDNAIFYFEQFIKKAPDDPDAPVIRKKLNDLVLAKQNSLSPKN